MSTTNELRLGLLPIITSYRQKKWITAAEECTFLKMISTSQFQSLGNNNSSDSLEVRVEKVKARLDEIEVANRVPENESLEDNQTDTAPSVTEGKGYTSSSTPLLNRHTRFPMTEYRKAIKNRREISSSNSKDDLEIENNYEYKSQVNVTSADIFDLAEDTSIMLKMSQCRHSEIEELFVGMISFAKLGFIQPPCCIRCAYASDKSGIDEMCENLVLWRKNANILIQPSCLKENSIILKCRAAQMLLSGKHVSNWLWDTTSRTLTLSKGCKRNVSTLTTRDSTTSFITSPTIVSASHES